MAGPAPVPFREALRVWTRIGLNSFGGPAGQIGVMHRVLVEEKRWIGEERFLHALNYCMLLPGPEAQQLAVYIGWLLHRTLGGLIAGILFVLPGALVMLGLSILYAVYIEVPLVDGLLFGVKAAVLAIVVEAILRIGRRALKNAVMVGVAAAAFVAIFFLAVPFPVIVLAAGVVGLVGAGVAPDRFAPSSGHGPAGPAVLGDAVPDHARPSAVRGLRIVAVCGTLWFAPLIALAATVGFDATYTQIGVFFSKMAVVTFGGAYAVLAYVAQEAVEGYGWLAPGEMLTGLGLAETTPGPLIMVVQFVGFLAAYRDAGTLDPILAGTLGGLLATWVTFVPCFLWIFLGAPYIEALRGNRRLGGALAAITAAVVGVVLNLALWFALHVLFAELGEAWFGPVRLLIPRWETVNLAAVALAAGSLVAMLRFRVGMLPTLAACAALGILLRVLV